jgi:hypothetical protein
LLRLCSNGLDFDWLVFDQGFGAAVPFLEILSLVGQPFVAEVPVNFAVADKQGGPTRRADQRLTAADAKRGRRYRLAHRTVADSLWRAASVVVWVCGQHHVLMVAINEATAEVQYFLSNVSSVPMGRLVAIAFCRWSVEHSLRLGKQEAGLMHYEGRDYTGLMRHLIVALVVLGFVATYTEQLRGEKSRGDGGASMPGTEPAVRGGIPPSSADSRRTAPQFGHLLSPASKCTGKKIPQETAAEMRHLKPRCTVRRGGHAPRPLA